MQQLNVNEIILMILPRMIDKEIDLQKYLLNQELNEGDTRFRNFREEVLNALKDLKEQVIKKQ